MNTETKTNGGVPLKTKDTNLPLQEVQGTETFTANLTPDQNTVVFSGQTVRTDDHIGVQG